MQIRHVLIKVDDQDKALSFYTALLGFRKHLDLGMGQARWLTVVSPEGADSVELVLETNSAPPSRAAQKMLYDAKFPAAVLTTNDIAGDYDRLTGRGVHFLGEPTDIGPVTTAFFDDTCGNVINLSQPKT